VVCFGLKRPKKARNPSFSLIFGFSDYGNVRECSGIFANVRDTSGMFGIVLEFGLSELFPGAIFPKNFENVQECSRMFANRTFGLLLGNDNQTQGIILKWYPGGKITR
jgi:hypothetical protein